MKAEAEKAQGGQQARLYAELAEQLVDVANQQFTNGSVTQAQATVQDVLACATKAHDASISSHNRLKETEIAFRKTKRHLDALKRTLAADDRPPLEDVVKKLEKFQQDLLNEMFAPPGKKKESKS